MSMSIFYRDACLTAMAGEWGTGLEIIIRPKTGTTENHQGGGTSGGSDSKKS